MASRGRFIAFEGGDGGGKSTQARILAERIGAVLTRQPGATKLGKRIREIVLDPEAAPNNVRAEALLFMADRADHVHNVIEPALADGRHVVTDRYAYSSLAYQGYGGGLAVHELQMLADWATGGLWPDVVVYLDVPLNVTHARRKERNGPNDRFEGAGDDFQRRVTDGFTKMAFADPTRWKIVDGTGSVHEVADRIWTAVHPLI